MKSGYIANKKDNTAGNLKAVKPLMESLGFTYTDLFNRFRMKRLWDTVFVFCRADRIIINIKFNRQIDTDYIDAAALAMLKLNSKYHTNLGLDENGEITADFTIFTPASPCSAQVFETLFFNHISNVEKRYNDILDSIDDYISRDIFAIDENLINIKIDLEGKKIEEIVGEPEPDQGQGSEPDLPTFDLSDLIDF